MQRWPKMHLQRCADLDYDEYKFPIDHAPDMAVRGRRLLLQYLHDAGAEKPSALEVIRNYQNALTDAGWKVVGQGDQHLTTMLAKAGRETWLNISYDPCCSLTFQIVEKGEMPMIVAAGKATARPAGATPDVAGAKDYPGIPRFAFQYVSRYADSAFDDYNFTTKAGPQHVAGRKINIGYEEDKGARVASVIHMQGNYQQVFESEGWVVQLSEPGRVTALLRNGERETWAEVSYEYYGRGQVTIVEKGPLPIVLHANQATARPAGATADFTGAKDYPGIPRFAFQYASNYGDAKFDQHDFPMATGRHHAEGRKIDISYEEDKGAAVVSPLEMQGNYQHVLEAEGWIVLLSKPGSLTAVLRKDRRETWVDIGYEYYGREHVTIVEVGELKQVVSASALLAQLDRDGHIAFEVHFDTGKDVIKAESKPVIAQMAAMLAQNAQLKVEVQGHTDNVGQESDNQALSDRRAKAVMAALVAAGVDAGRLTSRGYGQSQPVAENTTEGGRALNRRVELAKR